MHCTVITLKSLCRSYHEHVWFHIQLQFTTLPQMNTILLLLRHGIKTAHSSRLKAAQFCVKTRELATLEGILF